MLTYENDSSKFRLYAINTMLQTINEEPLESEEDFDKVREAQIAAGVLEETKKNVLSDEWDVAFDEAYSFPIDTSGFVNIPANVLDIYDDAGNLIMRDWKLYDKTAQSFIFESAQTVNVVWNTEFNNLPHPLRNYITVRASRVFQARQVMDTNIYAFTKEDEQMAYSTARRSEARSTSANMLDNIDIQGGFDERG